MLETFELKAFNAVAKHLNFARAAHEVGLSAPQFSKVIGTLEGKLGVKLLLRSTRSVRLTEEGHEFLRLSSEAMTSVRAAEQFFETSILPEEMVGTIRVTAPTTLGTRFLGPPLAQFQSRFPKVDVKVILADGYLNFVRDEIDVALRVMVPTDSDLIARKISSNNIYFYASPAYLKKHQSIKSINDLKGHSIYAIKPHWNYSFEKSGLSLKQIAVLPRLQTTNGDLLVELACAGGGIVARSEWGVQREVKQGQLVKIMLDDQLVSESGVYVVYPKDRYRPARVKAFIKILEKAIQLT